MLLCDYHKAPDRNNLKEEGYFLAHGRTAPIMVERKQREGECSHSVGFPQSPFLFHSCHWPLTDAHIRDRSSPLYNPLQKCPDGHTQRCA